MSWKKEISIFTIKIFPQLRNEHNMVRSVIQEAASHEEPTITNKILLFTKLRFPSLSAEKLFNSITCDTHFKLHVIVFFFQEGMLHKSLDLL